METIYNQIQIAYNFQGQIGMMANSFEIIIDKILGDNGIKQKLMLGQKIDQLNKIIKDEELITNLESFNDIWNITKHGKIISGEIQTLSFFKKGKIYQFDQRRQEQISSKFTEVMGKLMEVSKKSFEK